MKVDFEKQIESLPKKKNSFKEKLFNQSYFLRSSEFSSSTINKEEIVFDSKKSNIGLLLMVGLPCVFISLKFKDSYVFYPIIIFIIIAMLFNFIYLNNRKRKIIKIDNSGFEIENIKFDWDDIYDFGIMVKPNRYITYYELLVFSSSKGKKVYNLFSFQSEKDDILMNLNYFKKKYETNKNIS